MLIVRVRVPLQQSIAIKADDRNELKEEALILPFLITESVSLFRKELPNSRHKRGSTVSRGEANKKRI